MGIFSKDKTDEELQIILEKGSGYEDLSKSDLRRLTFMYIDTKAKLEKSIKVLKENSTETRTTYQNTINDLNDNLSKANKNYFQLQTTNRDLNDGLVEVGGLYNSAQVEISNLIKKNTAMLNENSNLDERLGNLESEVEKLKQPFNLDDLKSFIGEHKNKEYQAIKEALIETFSNGYSNLFGEQGEKEGLIGKSIDILASNGVQRYYSDGTADGVSIGVKFESNDFLLGKERINSMKINFEDSKNYDNEISKGYSEINFTATTDFYGDDIYKVSFSLSCPKDNPFREMIMHDAKTYVKAAVMGVAKRAIENQNYQKALNIIQNNCIEKFALPYIEKNKNNKEMIANFANLIPQDK